MQADAPAVNYFDRPGNLTPQLVHLKQIAEARAAQNPLAGQNKAIDSTVGGEGINGLTPYARQALQQILQNNMANGNQVGAY